MGKPVFKSWIYPVISGGVILLVWLFAARMIGTSGGGDLTPQQADNVRRIFLPYPSEIWQTAINEKEALWGAAVNTFQAAILGFLSAIVAGLLIALVLASSEVLKKSLYPWVLVLQMTPIIILAPIIAIWLNQGLISITVVSFLISFFPIVATTTLGLTSTSKQLIELFAVSKATRLQEILYLRIPFALPHFLTGAKIAATLAPIGAIAGDMFVGTSANGQAGLGFLTIIFKNQANTPAVYACAALACVMGFMFVGVVNYVQWLVLHNWHDSALSSE